MKDFPFFTTENGVASLTLKEIPYKHIAYIKIQDSADPMMLLEECISFCRVCGAEKIYAAGADCLEQFPLHTKILEMRGIVQQAEIPCLFPVTENTVGKWRECYNSKMRDVPNAATLEAKEEKEILDSRGAYFVHENGELLGIAWMDDTKLLAIAACKNGAGEKIMAAMQSLIEDDSMVLEVADTNKKALSLYHKMGFMIVSEKSRWYQVF